MSYIPALLRRDAGYHTSIVPSQPFRRSTSAGLCGLHSQAEHRYLAGLSHIGLFGRRVEAEFWLGVIDDRLDLEGVLGRLDQYRETLSPEIVRAAGADLVPGQAISMVPR